MPSAKTADRIKADFLIVGGGTAGLMAAILLKQRVPRMRVAILEKAHAKRSGCLAMGLNAVNLYLTDGNVDDYVNYVREDNFGIVREDLVRTIGERANKFVPLLESFGVPFPKDEKGQYITRSKRSIAMNGERLKPILYQQAVNRGVDVYNHMPTIRLVQDAKGRVLGVQGFNLRTGRPFVALSRATLFATGGASGIYRPSNPETAPKKTWYCPYNAGSGLAMGFRAGAEMTSFEMRFIALRTKDVIAPTGTLVLGTTVKQINARGEEYLKNARSLIGRNLATCERLFYTMEEHRSGRGPCLMDMTHLSDSQFHEMLVNYLDMSPSLVLQLLGNPLPLQRIIEVAGSEPYVNGGHGMAGFWITKNRTTTLEGLYAAGDTAGGSPKKYITGCFAEAEIAVEHFLNSSAGVPPTVAGEPVDIFAPLTRQSGLHYSDIETRLQKIMDEYAGGYSMNYATNKEKLNIARELLFSLEHHTAKVGTRSFYELLKFYEAQDKILLARILVEHLLERKETRWPAYQTRLDFPGRNEIEFNCFINSIQKNGDIKMRHRQLAEPFKITGASGD